MRTRSTIPLHYIACECRDRPARESTFPSPVRTGPDRLAVLIVWPFRFISIVVANSVGISDERHADSRIRAVHAEGRRGHRTR
jgi:hypothetical protein